MKILLLITTTLLLLTFNNPISAENFQYKWKDANGETHYTERPPADGIAFEKIRVKTHVAPESSQSSIKNAVDKKENADTTEDDKYGGWRKENCKRAIQNLDILENAGRISQDDGDGGTRLMNDEEKQEKIKAMTAQKDKYCSPVNQE